MDKPGLFSEHDAAAKIGARQFHQETRRDEIVDLIVDYDSQFLDSESGMLMERLSLQRKCPVCSEDAFKVSFVKQGFKYCKCKTCNMLYVNPILKEENSNCAYRSGEVSNKIIEVLLSPTQRDYDHPKFVKALELIENAMPQGSQRRLLDIGCSIGHFLEVAKSSNWNCIGIELNEAAAGYTERMGFEVVREPLMEGLFPEKHFDVVTMWDVLEHIPDPGRILKVIRNILTPNGILSLIVPNADSLAARIMREKCTMFRGSSHVNIFNHETLSRLLEREGFRTDRMMSLIGEINVINNWLSYQDPYKGESAEKNSILGIIDEQTIHDNLLGYKLFCMARKVR